MNSNRSALIDEFLHTAGWKNARRQPLAGDASFRRYERVVEAGRQTVLMDAPPDKEDIRPFVQVAQELIGLKMSAPSIIAQDEQHGLLLLEDLGDDLFTRVLKPTLARELELYLAAADILIALYRQRESVDTSRYPSYDETLYARETDLFADWFLPAVFDSRHAAALSADYKKLWVSCLQKLPPLPEVLVLRDYHADNLLWLPERAGMQRVGLLDFQDAVMGSPAYDMVSFLEDARRDVQAETVEKVMRYYLSETGLSADDFRAAYALLGAQRNCKIIGIFARLAVRDGKLHYLSYLPRVWGHLQRDLAHPLLAPLQQWMDKNIAPDLRGVFTIDDMKKKIAP